MNRMDEEYFRFLESKKKKVQSFGFDIQESELNQSMFDFQKHIVRKAIKAGKYAIFADTGLGKTIMQLSWAEAIMNHIDRPVLIIAPLAVSGQTIEEGKKFNIHVERFIGFEGVGIYITNYEQLEYVNPDFFSGVVLDESSILKNFTGKIKEQIIDMFKDTQYKLACTATPSPNDLMELGNHSEFLNYMSRNEMLSMYFVHDGGDTAKWRLKGHSKKDFYAWIGSWSTVLTNPENIGFKDEGLKFKLPELNYFEQKVITDKKDNGLLFNESAVNATDFNKELRETKELRLNKVKEIIDNNPDEYFIIWINQNEEGDYLKSILKGYDFREVRGSDKTEDKEKNLLDFAHGNFKILITKGKIAGQGMNFQKCHNQIFAALDFSFEKLYQSVRRSYRFGQKDNVNIYLITTDTMQNVIETIKEKEKMFTELREEMQNIINYEKREHIRKIDNSDDFITEDCRMLNGDCIRRIKEIEDNSIGFSIFSPPFSSLYTFSDDHMDLSNCKNHDEFFNHFEFLIPEIKRITQDGRLVAVHCMDLTTNIGRDGYLSIIDFRGMIIRLFQKYGFYYHNEITIWKNPVVEVTRTKNIQLLYSQCCKDATISRTSLPDRLLVFRKEGINKNPVTHDKTEFSPSDWGELASPVWMTINQSNTINFRDGREQEDEKHISALQLDVIKRALFLWSNHDDIIFTPFMGCGSEVYQALKMNRKAIGIELKDSYFKQAVKNVKTIYQERSQGELFG